MEMTQDVDVFVQQEEITPKKRKPRTAKPKVKLSPEYAEYLDPKKTIMKMEAVLKRLKISRYTFLDLVREGVLPCGSIASKHFVPKEGLLEYLNNVHLVKRTNEDDVPVYNRIGEPMPKLTVSKEKLEELPDLKTAEEMAKRLGVTPKTIVYYCANGELPCYKVGSTYRISEEDWENQLKDLVDKPSE